MLRFHKTYALLSFLLFAVEVSIALFVHDRFIRPYVGDFLVVILLYCFVRSFFKTPVITTGVVVLLFAYAVEVTQYFDLAKRLGVQSNTVLRTLIGSSFEWSDMLAYTLGALAVVLIETRRQSLFVRRL